MSVGKHPSAPDGNAEITTKPASRKSCQRCERPASVCLCASLPSKPLALAGKVIVLQHPHEHKKRMATVPLLQKCVVGVEVLRCRTYRPELDSHAPLHSALADAAAGLYPLLVLFPGGGARDLQQLAAELRAGGGAGSGTAQLPAACASRQAEEEEQEVGRAHQAGCQQQGEPWQPVQQQAALPQQLHRGVEMQQGQQPGQGGQRQPLYALLVIDGTWKQAKEMYRAVLPLVLPPNGPGVRVQLPLPPRTAAAAAACEPFAAQASAAAGEPSAGAQAAAAAAAGTRAAAGDEAPLLLRTEPMEGCLTTCEAAARALGWLEGPVRGPVVKDAVLQPLAALARFQARWDPALAVRLSDGAHYSQARCRMGMGKQGVLELIP